jgi:hypothetical protein
MASRPNIIPMHRLYIIPGRMLDSQTVICNMRNIFASRSDNVMRQESPESLCQSEGLLSDIRWLISKLIQHLLLCLTNLENQLNYIFKYFLRLLNV